ncbi:MAG: hypothetical protein FJ171_11435 [Gammaproteobacteria bacterium]|nr:hypothetical protein [Gammaproteobacteria bacterium]
MSAWRQRLKWLVYAALAANFLVYLYQDVEYAPYVLDADSSIREVLVAYATSIDLVAWFTLILLFEVETTVRAGRPWEGAAKWAVKGVRVLCYATVLHTTFANVMALEEFRHPAPLPPAADVCAYAGEWTLLRNRDYLEIDAGNCRTLGRGHEFFALSDDKVLTDREGLAEGTLLAWTDIAESVAWLLIVVLTEVAVRRLRISRGLRPRPAHLLRAKMLLYAAILAISLFWGSKGQILYLWDELVWILGFLVIDWNLRDWQRFRRAFSVSPTAA